MKRFSLLIFLLLILCTHVEAQRRYNGLIYRGKQQLVTCMDMSAGYIWDHKYENFTLSTAFNNLYLKRWGAFAMVELDPVNPAIVIGPTVSINDFAFVYTGIDFITQRGYFARNGLKHSRKDLGIGFYPWSWATVKICHSFNAGSRVEVGIRIPMGREAAYIKPARKNKSGL